MYSSDLRGLFFINSFAFCLELLISGSNFYLFFNFFIRDFFCSFLFCFLFLCVCSLACLNVAFFCSCDYFSLFLFIYLFFFFFSC